MDRKALIKLLVKIFPLFICILIVWQYLGISRLYHEALAPVLAILFALFDPLGPVKDVTAGGGEFAVRLVIHGRDMPLFLTAEDITSNTAMLLTLYLASPFKSQVRKFIIHLFLAVFVLYWIHIFTIASTIKFAMMSNPQIISLYPAGRIEARLVPFFINFYENLGMYLFALVLWLPYITTRLLFRRKPESSKSVPEPEPEI